MMRRMIPLESEVVSVLKKQHQWRYLNYYRALDLTFICLNIFIILPVNRFPLVIVATDWWAVALQWHKEDQQGKVQKHLKKN